MAPAGAGALRLAAGDPQRSDWPSGMLVSQNHGSNTGFAVEAAVQGPAGQAWVQPVAGTASQISCVDSVSVSSERPDRHRVHPIATSDTGLLTWNGTFCPGEPVSSILAAQHKQHGSAQDESCEGDTTERERCSHVSTALSVAPSEATAAGVAGVSVEAARNMFF